MNGGFNPRQPEVWLPPRAAVSFGGIPGSQLGVGCHDLPPPPRRLPFSLAHSLSLSLLVSLSLSLSPSLPFSGMYESPDRTESTSAADRWPCFRVSRKAYMTPPNEKESFEFGGSTVWLVDLQGFFPEPLPRTPDLESKNTYEIFGS